MKQDEVFEAIAGIANLSTELITMDAIWLDKPLQIEGKRSIRIAPGDKVRLRNNLLLGYLLGDTSDEFPATHVITECRGTIYSTLLEVEVKDLVTGELLTIKL